MNTSDEKLPGWMTPQERWAYQKLIAGKPAIMLDYHSDAPDQTRGKTADCATYEDSVGNIAPVDDSNWADFQFLTARFLERICIDKSLRARMERSQVDIRNARFKERINLSEEEILGTVSLYDCRFDKGLSLLGSQIRGSLNLQSVHVCADDNGSALQCGRLKTGGYVFLRRRGLYEGSVHLTSGEINGSVQLTGSRFDGRLEMGSLIVRDDLLLDDSSRQRPAPQWTQNSAINLKNAKIGALQSSYSAWLHKGAPIPRNLDGFKCERLSGGFGGKSIEHSSDKHILQWLRDEVGPLAKEQKFTPTKYITTANALKLAGYDNKASKVRIALEQDRTKALSKLNPWKWIRLWLVGPTTAYGYKPYLGIFWFLAIVLLFAIIGLFWSGESSSTDLAKLWSSFKSWFGFSLETAFPIFELDPVEDQFLQEKFLADGHNESSGVLPNYVRAVFMIERMIGILLLSTLVASLASWAERKEGE